VEIKVSNPIQLTRLVLAFEDLVDSGIQWRDAYSYSRLPILRSSRKPRGAQEPVIRDLDYANCLPPTGSNCAFLTPENWRFMEAMALSVGTLEYRYLPQDFVGLM
jgi:hypothetical protein